MVKKPLVSIVTACLNHEPYLDQYIAGLLAQSYPEMELIFLDDGSTDRSWEMMEQYRPFLIQKFRRVVCQKNENRGYRREIELGISLAEGDFICLLDSDDFFHPDKVEKCAAYLEAHPEMGVVHTDLDFVYPDRVIYSHWKSMGKQITPGDVFEDLLTEFYILPSASCIRAELFNLFIDFDSYDRYPMTDLPLFLDLALHTQVGYIDEALTAYRVRQSSMARPADTKEHLNFHRSIYQVRCDYAANPRVSEGLRGQVWRNYFSALYRKGYEFCSSEESLEGFHWLAKNYPRDFDNRWHRLSAYSTRHPLLWKTLRYLRSRRPFETQQGRR